MTTSSASLGKVSPRTKVAITIRGLALGILFISSPALSQLNLGRILGAITDQSGGAIAGATVTVIDVSRGVSRPLTADSAGEYSAPSLIPGTYTVRAEAKGFRTVERQNIELGVGQDLRWTSHCSQGSKPRQLP